MNNRVILMILDGFGLRDESDSNAVLLADTPTIDRLERDCPFVYGNASGSYVGLPKGQMGNSEVGHLNIGAGRIVYQDLTKITKQIEDGSFFKNKALTHAFENVTQNSGNLHVMGLLSDGGVHSHMEHLYAIVRMAKEKQIQNLFIHCFTDGRDTPPTSGLGYVEKLEDVLKKEGVGKIATIVGRYYAMDRDRRWERVRRAYEALTDGVGALNKSPISAISDSYESGTTDEFIEPVVICDKDGTPIPRIADGDSVIFFNFRPDRARELSRAFLDKDFSGFGRKLKKDLVFIGFTEYDPTISGLIPAYPKETIKNTLGQYLAAKGKTQLRLAETEKYAHVTFFFNGGVEEPNAGEERQLIPSPRVATYDLQPQMSAYDVCDALIAAIDSRKYDFIAVNFANPDMVGHTGSLPAAIRAVEAVDRCVNWVLEAVSRNGDIMLLVADHGNAETMMDEKTGEPFTAHTANPVPFILINADKGTGLKEGGALCDIAPTVLELMGLEIPDEMTGTSLLTHT